MSTERKDKDAPSPDRYMERDVTDLRITVGKFEERIDGIKENMVTKAELANSWVGWLKWAVMLLIPLLAAALGALAITFSGIVRVVLGT